MIKNITALLFGLLVLFVLSTIIIVDETEQIVISDEHLGFLWTNFDNAKQKTTYDNAKLIITKAENLLSKTL